MKKNLIFVFLLISSLPLSAKTVLRASISRGLKKQALVLFSPVFAKSEVKDKGVELDRVLKGDFSLCGDIVLVDRSSPFVKASADTGFDSDTMNNFKPFGAEFLVKVKAEDQLGVLVIYFKIYDLNANTLIAKDFIKTTKDKLRSQAHRLSAKILKSITGREGLGLSEIAFVSDHKGSKTIFSCDVQGQGIRQLVAHKAMSLSPDWTYDKRSIIYTTYERINPCIFMKDLQTGRFEGIAMFPGLNANPKVNKRNEIVFTASKDGNPEIYKKNIISGKFTRLTKRGTVDASPCWSPDGDHIAFVSQGRGLPQIYIMNRAGGDIRRITGGGSYYSSPSWSPDGNFLAYCIRVHGRLNIEILNLNTRETDMIVSGFGSAEAPCWSPDSSHIAFQSDRNGKWDIYAVNVSTGEILRITKGFGNCTNPSWK